MFAKYGRFISDGKRNFIFTKDFQAFFIENIYIFSYLPICNIFLFTAFKALYSLLFRSQGHEQAQENITAAPAGSASRKNQ